VVIRFARHPLSVLEAATQPNAYKVVLLSGRRRETHLSYLSQLIHNHLRTRTPNRYCLYRG